MTKISKVGKSFSLYKFQIFNFVHTNMKGILILRSYEFCVHKFNAFTVYNWQLNWVINWKGVLSWKKPLGIDERMHGSLRIDRYFRCPENRRVLLAVVVVDWSDACRIRFVLAGLQLNSFRKVTFKAWPTSLIHPKLKKKLF